MATFTYKSLAGGPGATIDAPDRGTALRELMRRGVTPSALDEVSPANDAAPAPRASPQPGARMMNTGMAGAMSRAEMAAFIRELATALQAGLPLVLALRTIARQGRSDRQRVMLERIIDHVEHGRSLAEACASVGKPFNELTINMMRAGEASGRLETVLLQAAELLDRDVKLRRSVLSATLYPMILTALITLAIIVVVTFIVPSILKSVQGQVIKMPLPTRIVQGVAHFFGTYWWLVIPAAFTAIVGIRRTYEQPGPRLWFDTNILKVPVLGRMLRDVAVARFTRTLGTLTGAGVPILQALRITKGTLGNRAMEGVIETVTEQVAGGRTIADPMEKSGYFPPMLVQIVNLGERSGRLDEMLSQAAGAFEDRTETSIKLFTTALPPLLVVCLACVVGFIVLSILLPLLELQDAAR